MSPAEHAGSTVLGGTLNLINTCVGGGTALVALPLAMANLGLVAGVAAFAFFAVIVAFSLWLLIAASESLSEDTAVRPLHSERTALLVNAGALVEHNQGVDDARGTITYNELAYRAYGTRGLTLFNLTVLINNVGMAVLFLDLLGDILPSLLADLLHVHVGVWYLSRTLLLAGITLALFPLLLFKRIEALKWASLVGIAAATVLVGVVVYAAKAHRRVDSPPGSALYVLAAEPSHPLRSFGDAFVGVPIIVFVYTCHYNMFAIHNGLPSATRARAMWRVIVNTFTFNFLLYVLVGVCGYVAFRSGAQANVITQLAAAHVAPYALMVAVQLGFSVGIVFTIPLFNLEARVGFQYVWRQLHRCVRPAPRGRDELVLSIGLEPPPADTHLSGVFVLETAVLSAVFLGISLVVKDIGVVFGVIGATTATAISYVYPALFFLRLVPRSRRSLRMTRAAVALLVFGATAGAISLAAAIDAMV